MFIPIIKILIFLITLLSELINSEQISSDTVVQMVKNTGYPIEVHTVETSDGYLLTLHRIPSSLLSTPTQSTLTDSSRSSRMTNGYDEKKKEIQDGKIVFIMHGLLCSSADYLVSGPGKSIGYTLADGGYDVWLGNARGTTNSKRHRVLQSDMSQYWDFSWHEIAEFDIPASIDYILGYTNQSALHYVGHSQGTTVYFAMLAIKPQYNKKIRSMTAMAPAVYFLKNGNSIIRYLVNNIDQLESAFKILDIYELMSLNTDMESLISMFCSDGATTQSICKNFISSVVGSNPTQFNTTLLPIVFRYTPAGISYRQFLHFGQIIRSGRFQMYDYHRDKNLRIYKREKPPMYDIRNRVHTPINIFYGTHDLLVAKDDVLTLIKELRKTVPSIEVHELLGWNHIDFMYAIDANKFVYAKILKYLNKFQ